jgi:hypothetical protein
MTSAHPSIVAPMALNMRIDTWDTDDEHPDHPNQTGRSWRPISSEIGPWSASAFEPPSEHADG